MTYVESGRKELKTDWPHEVGLVFGTTKQTGKTMNLLPQGKLGVKSTVQRSERVGF